MVLSSSTVVAAVLFVYFSVGVEVFVYVCIGTGGGGVGLYYWKNQWQP
jgi:hypothetical protein